MSVVYERCIAFVLMALFASAASSQDISGSWTLRIENLDRKEITSMTIRFTQQSARSCIGGEWKRVVVDSAKTTDERFFPISDTWSYNVVGSDLTIGRNEVCDAYLRMKGKLGAAQIQGPHFIFGLHGGTDLGTFSLTKNP